MYLPDSSNGWYRHQNVYYFSWSNQQLSLDERSESMRWHGHRQTIIVNLISHTYCRHARSLDYAVLSLTLWLLQHLQASDKDGWQSEDNIYWLGWLWLASLKANKVRSMRREISSAGITFHSSHCQSIFWYDIFQHEHYDNLFCTSQSLEYNESTMQPVYVCLLLEKHDQHKQQEPWDRWWQWRFFIYLDSLQHDMMNILKSLLVIGPLFSLWLLLELQDNHNRPSFGKEIFSETPSYKARCYSSPATWSMITTHSYNLISLSK